MKRLNQNLKASAVVNALTTNKNDKYVGAIVRFKQGKRTGTIYRTETFEICGTQKVWGYNQLGQYAMIDGYRAFAITYKDEFGCACSLDELEIISMPS